MQPCADEADRGVYRNETSMSNFAVALVIVVVVGVIALFARHRQRVDVPTQKVFSVPSQIDRRDFDQRDLEPKHFQPDVRTGSDIADSIPEWLVVVFTSKACQVCADVWDKVLVVASRNVAVYQADYEADRELHQRYGIDAVPTLVICDGEGVVKHHFLGPVSATDLWAAVATVRDPASRPNGRCQHS